MRVFRFRESSTSAMKLHDDDAARGNLPRRAIYSTSSLQERTRLLSHFAKSPPPSPPHPPGAPLDGRQDNSGARGAPPRGG